MAQKVKRKKSKGKIVAKIVVLAIFLLLLAYFYPTLQGFMKNPPATESVTYPQKLEFEFERTIKIDTKGTYALNITIPQNTTFQKVKVLDLSNLPKRIIHVDNRTVWSFTLKDSAQITLRYMGRTTAKRWNIDNSLDVNAIPPELKKKYNHPEYIEESPVKKRWVIQPGIFKNVTQNITQGDRNVVEKLGDIYHFMVTHFQYVTERSGLPRSAVETWNSGSGDCDELSFVFISMARSIGIPAWMEYGLLYTGSSWGPHGWVATVVPTSHGLVYVNIDITTEVGKEDYGRGFLFRDPYHLTEWQDDGNSSHLTEYYTFIQGHYGDMNIEDSVNVIKSQESGEIKIPVESSRLPGWLMAVFILTVVIIIIILILKW